MKGLVSYQTLQGGIIYRLPGKQGQVHLHLPNGAHPHRHRMGMGKSQGIGKGTAHIPDQCPPPRAFIR